MAAEPLSETDVSWFGVLGDRRWAFVRPDVPQSGFPWFTLREQARLRDYRPRFVDPSLPDKSATIVRTPSGAEFEVTDPALRAEMQAGGLQVIRQGRGVFDTFPLSLITTRAIASLAAATGVSLEVQRFRPNLLIEAKGDSAYPEDDWVGRVLRIVDAHARGQARRPVRRDHHGSGIRAAA